MALISIRIAYWPDGTYVAYGSSDDIALNVSNHTALIEGMPIDENIVWLHTDIEVHCYGGALTVEEADE